MLIKEAFVAKPTLCCANGNKLSVGGNPLVYEHLGRSAIVVLGRFDYVCSYNYFFSKLTSHSRRLLVKKESYFTQRKLKS